LAIFVPVGINIIGYQIESKFDTLRYTGKGTDASPFVGAGFSLKLIDNIYLNGEYNYTTINYKKPMYENKSTKATLDIEGKAHINTMRAGISWNFQI
jgi:opacity protein-like surface antigen